MSEYRILIIDPDKDFCGYLQSNLKSEGYHVETCQSAKDTLDMKLFQYDLLILETQLSDGSGFKLVHEIRNQKDTSSLPIIFMSSKPGENEMMTAFSVGADDFLLKPFFIRELAARIKVIIRRSEELKNANVEILVYEQLKLNLSKMQVKVAGETVPFTKKEFEIMKLFLENKNRIFSRDDLLKLIWSEEAFILGRTIDVNITRIRQKIGNYSNRIVTKIGVGYSFEG
jgi:two-component system, OmpR family, alkaline phosphatase synthesis response regulator PhoP